MKKVFMLLFTLVVSMSNLFSRPNTEDKMVSVVILMDNGEDKEVVTTIYTSLIAAEKVAKMVDVELVASDNPVRDDIFVFTVKSEEQKDLTMKMFDEEGYEVAAYRVISVNEGSNYKALNVESMEDGTYIFQLSDESGAELTKKVVKE